MANRQYGRGRSPAGGRNPADGRLARAVPVSRRPAAERNSGAAWTAPRPGTPGCWEPEVRRWSHPVTESGSSTGPEPAMHYIRCALSYQNQLLADMKSLLERIAAGEEVPAEPAEDGGTKL